MIVLAGGESRRMKRDKALLPLPGGTLIEWVVNRLQDYFHRVIISASPGQRLDFLPHPVVFDREQGQGPLLGIRTGLAASNLEVNFVIACDIPVIDTGLVKRIIAAGEEADIAVPVTASGRYEPLFALYKKSILPEIDRLLDCGTRKIIPLYSRCRTRTVPLPDGLQLANLNTPRDYRRFLKRFYSE